jgi:hypothetical protein
MNYDKKTNQAPLDQPVICAFCGQEPTAVWAGAQQVAVCQNCAIEVLPALIADSVPNHLLRRTEDVRARMRSLEVEIGLVFNRALMSRYIGLLQQADQPVFGPTIKDVKLGEEERLLAEIILPGPPEAPKPPEPPKP